MTLKPNPNTEKYLFTDFYLVEHTVLLAEENDIETFFTENTELLGDRQDGFEDEKEFLVKIGDKYYDVTVSAEVYNLGGNDDLWASDVTEVTWEEVEKPLPLIRKEVVITVQATSEVLRFLENYLNTKGCDFAIQDNVNKPELKQVMEYLGQALRNFEYVGNIMNNMDAVTEHDESQTIDLSEARNFYDNNCLGFNLPNTDELFRGLVYSEE